MQAQQKPLIYRESSSPNQCEDCACAATSFTPTHPPPLAAQYWQKAPALRLTPLPDDHTLAFNPYGPAGAVVLNPAARAILNNFALPARLTNSTAQQLAQLELLQPTGASLSAPPQEQIDTLTAWLHLSQQCNLRCAYCFLAKDKAEMMDLPTGKTAIDAVFRAAQQRNLPRVTLKYAGGEPLFNLKLIRQLHRYAQQQAQVQNIHLEEVILSNGTLLSRHTLAFIRQAGIRLMVSLDGVEDAHNAQRPLANGSGSFKLVKEGIERAIAQGISPHLSITITGGNAQDAANAVAFALDRNLTFNLNFYRENAYAAAAAASDEQLIAAMRAAFAVIEARLPRYSLLGSLIDRANFSNLHTHSCGVGQNYLVIDHQGQIARCQMDMENPVTSIYAADPLTPLAETTSGFQNLPVDEKDDCQQCEWRYWCGGGCSLLAYRTTGRVNAKSPYCQVYKTLYPEALRLEGLRLLKWKPGVH